MQTVQQTAIMPPQPMATDDVAKSARRRALLSALGIPVWLARSNNDAITASPIALTTVDFIPVWLGDAVHKPDDHKAQMGSVQSQPRQVLQPKTTTPNAQQTAVASANNRTATLTTAETVTAIQSASVVTSPYFVLQARHGSKRFAHWLLLVDEAELLNPTAKTLWQDITLAVEASAAQTLQWPFVAQEKWQRAELAISATQGFLSQLQQTQAYSHIALFGTLPAQLAALKLPNVVTLPALTQLLAQPLLKRDVWQTLTATTSST